jgi:hypothetical protein
MTNFGKFSTPASESELQHLVVKLKERNIEGIIVDNAEGARKQVLERIPVGAEVHSGKSKTLQDSGIMAIIQESNQYDALRLPHLITCWAALMPLPKMVFWWSRLQLEASWDLIPDPLVRLFWLLEAKKLCQIWKQPCSVS